MPLFSLWHLFIFFKFKFCFIRICWFVDFMLETRLFKVHQMLWESDCWISSSAAWEEIGRKPKAFVGDKWILVLQKSAKFSSAHIGAVFFIVRLLKDDRDSTKWHAKDGYQTRSRQAGLENQLHQRDCHLASSRHITTFISFSVCIFILGMRKIGAN